MVLLKIDIIEINIMSSILTTDYADSNLICEIREIRGSVLISNIV